MISTLAELLEVFTRKEVEMLDKYKINHAPTIGSMYEGLTREVLSRSIPEGLDLRVTSGFIVNDDGLKSNQIDCMLVVGDGETIPFTDTFIYHIRKVIAVIEVKKNLYTNELDSAYQNLVSVTALRETSLPMNNLFDDACRVILGSTSDIFQDTSQLPIWKREVGKALYFDSISPVRIVLGYHGFASEMSFRQAFIDYLEGKIEAGGYGAYELPNLIICNQYSIIKTNGMPYGASLFNSDSELYERLGMPNHETKAPVTDDLWLLCASYPASPLILFLELIWTRITYYLEIFIPEFGSDLQNEILRPLLLAKAISHENKTGWFYEHLVLSEERLKGMPLVKEWEPIDLDIAHFILLSQLVNEENNGRESLNIITSGLSEYFGKQGYSLDATLTFLEQKRLISVEEKNVRLLTREIKVMALPDGRFVAGDDVSGRLTNWIITYFDKDQKTNNT